MTQGPIIVEQILNAPVDKVWKAITDKVLMRKWYFNVSDFKPKVGFEFTFEGGNEKKTFLHLCKVTESVAFSKIAYTWKYQGYSGESLVTFELFAGGNTTRLKLTHSGVETFPKDTNDFARENFVQGWTHLIGKSLPAFLAP